MKKLLLGLALLGLASACRSSGAGMHDSSCTGPDCTDCTKEQMENCSDCKEPSAECKGMTECKEGAEGAVCPVTGKAMN